MRRMGILMGKISVSRDGWARRVGTGRRGRPSTEQERAKSEFLSSLKGLWDEAPHDRMKVFRGSPRHLIT